MDFKPYSGNGKPFVFAMFAPEDRVDVEVVLAALQEKGYEIWPSMRFDKKRLDKSALVLLFLSPAAKANEAINTTITHMVQSDHPLLAVHLAPTSLMPAQRLLLNTQQGILRHECASEEAFYDKLFGSSLMRDLQVTPAQKRAASWTTWGLSGIIVLAVALTVVLALQSGAKVPEDSLLAELGYTGRMADIENIYLYGESVDDKRSDTTIIGTRVDWENYQKIPTVFYQGFEKTANIGNLEEVSDFSQLKNLKELSIAGNQITDVSPLWKLKNLEYLDLTGNPIKDITGIGKLSRLKELCVGGTQIVDLGPLADCVNLETVLVDEEQYAKQKDMMNGLAFDLVVVGPVEEMRTICCHIFGGIEEWGADNAEQYYVYSHNMSNNNYLSYVYEVFRDDAPLNITQIRQISVNSGEDDAKTELRIDNNQMTTYNPNAIYTLKITCEGYSATYQIWHKYDDASKVAMQGNLLYTEGF